MAQMTSAERVLCALRREEPDRVPHFEWLIAANVRTALCPSAKTHLDFALAMDHDALLVDPDWRREQVSETRYRSEWGYVLDYGHEEHGVEVESPIASLADFERYTPPDPTAPGRFATLERVVAEHKGKRAIGVHLNDVFSVPRYLMGMENLLYAVAGEPELIRGLVDMSVEVNLALAKEVAQRGADFVWTGDDYAGNNGPLMSPKSFRELFWPGLRRVAQGFAELGLPFIKHCDGNIWPIIDLMVEAGPSCLDPIDQQGGMDLAEVKAKFGDRVALKGNVDCGEVLPFGTVEETIAETKRALREGAPGGGFILSSSNSIHSSVKPENYAAMMDTWRRYGQYPVCAED
ncbi:MAG: hypothetical protein HZB16_21835 [Armatimonadetes bacterium]|nr:hypothetical protein [Armatimonadota bacterium]